MAVTRNNKLGENTCVDDTAAHLMSAHLMHCSIGLQGVFFNKMKMFSYHSLGNVNKAHGLWNGWVKCNHFTEDFDQNCYLWLAFYDILSLWPHLMLQLTWPKFCCSLLLQKIEISVTAENKLKKLKSLPKMIQWIQLCMAFNLILHPIDFMPDLIFHFKQAADCNVVTKSCQHNKQKA